jgi:hypothetical protein
MDITSSMRSFLLEDASIATAFGVRIYVVFAPATETYPFSTINAIGDNPTYTQDGEALRETTIQIDTYDDSLADCITNGKLIRQKLTGYKGLMGDVEVGAIFVIDEFRDWSAEIRRFRLVNRFSVKWSVYE